MRLAADIWGLPSCSAMGKLFASWDGMTPLSVAAFFGDEALVRCLLEAESDATIANLRGDFPLDLATAQQHHQVIELFGMFSV